MKITYIHHSSFSVEINKCILLFDYYKGNLPKFDENKKLYVFSSHSHYDHFDKAIFDLEKTHPNVTYILSNDIHVPKKDNIKFMGANERLLVDDLEIKTLFKSKVVEVIIDGEFQSLYYFSAYEYMNNKTNKPYCYIYIKDNRLCDLEKSKLINKLLKLQDNLEAGI